MCTLRKGRSPVLIKHYEVNSRVFSDIIGITVWTVHLDLFLADRLLKILPLIIHHPVQVQRRFEPGN
ncbi:hypothetical protein [Cylindrospermopsis raciborskii]|uniref:hypothetical protein n=1 Tax=Cylindrospermopsis raciborskii TaxID=77022 RepID=UPI0015C4A960|nr:hypothetical protein [Cylindrospermopsis raciborskii]